MPKSKGLPVMGSSGRFSSRPANNKAGLPPHANTSLLQLLNASYCWSWTGESCGSSFPFVGVSWQRRFRSGESLELRFPFCGVSHYQQWFPSGASYRLGLHFVCVSSWSWFWSVAGFGLRQSLACFALSFPLVGVSSFSFGYHRLNCSWSFVFAVGF